MKADCPTGGSAKKLKKLKDFLDGVNGQACDEGMRPRVSILHGGRKGPPLVKIWIAPTVFSAQEIEVDRVDIDWQDVWGNNREPLLNRMKVHDTIQE